MKIPYSCKYDDDNFTSFLSSKSGALKCPILSLLLILLFLLLSSHLRYNLLLPEIIYYNSKYKNNSNKNIYYY